MHLFKTLWLNHEARLVVDVIQRLRLTWLTDVHTSRRLSSGRSPIDQSGFLHGRQKLVNSKLLVEAGSLWEGSRIAQLLAKSTSLIKQQQQPFK